MELLDPRLAAFVAVMAVLIVTPGPDTALVIRNTIAGGSWTASVAYEVMLIAWLHVYVVALGRARRSVAFGRIQAALRRLTGAVMIGLGARLALEHR